MLAVKNQIHKKIMKYWQNFVLIKFSQLQNLKRKGIERSEKGRGGKGEKRRKRGEEGERKIIGRGGEGEEDKNEKINFW